MITKEDKRLVQKVLSNVDYQYLLEDIIFSYTYHSNKIENNSLSLKETITVLRDGFGVSKPIKDIYDTLNHHRASLYVMNVLATENKKISLNDIRDIQSLVKPEIPGFRKIPVEISNTHVKTTDAFDISYALENIINEYYTSGDDLFNRLAKFHVQFECIHPFLDGNGRTGRLLLNLELIRNNYPLTAIKFEDKPDYYQAFNDVPKMKDLIVKSVKDTIELVKKVFFSV